MNKAKEKLQEIIDHGKVNVVDTLQEIQDEFEIRQDLIARPSAIRYKIDENGITPIIQDQPHLLTQHSESQLFQRTQIPGTYAKKLLGLGEYNLLHDNLMTMTERLNGDGILYRKVGNTIKGMLSPSYRRMDATPIFESFVAQSIKSGYVPYRAMNTDYRYQITMLFPEVFEPSTDEHVVYGLSLVTGDYGGQALDLSIMALRIACSNLAVGYDMFRKIHIGQRFQLGNEEAIELSAKTHALDSETVASAITDVVTNSLNHIEVVNQIVTESTGINVDARNVIRGLRSKGIPKEVTERIQVVYDMEAPVTMLPQKKGLWRLSNAISLIAGNAQGDKRIDLEKTAMDILLSASHKSSLGITNN